MRQVDPPAGLRGRILQRLDASPPQAFAAWRYAFAAAALAAVVLVAVLVRDRGAVSQAPPATAAAAVQQPQPAAVPEIVQAELLPQSSPRAVTPSRAAARPGRRGIT